MILEIHSKFGVLLCEPMKLQAIENSIPEAAEPKETNQDTEVSEEIEAIDTSSILTK